MTDNLMLSHRIYIYEGRGNPRFLDKLGCINNMNFIPVFTFYETIDEDGVFGLNCDVNNMSNLGRSYAQPVAVINKGNKWYRMGVAGCENLVVNRGAIMDISDESNPIMLMALAIKADKKDKYIRFDSTKGFYMPTNRSLDIEDVVLFMAHDFVLGSNPFYKKVYKRFMKDIFLDEVFGKDMTIIQSRDITSALFVERKFPIFGTLDERKEFYRILPSFISAPHKLNFKRWQPTATAVPDTSGNATLLSSSQSLSDSSRTSEQTSVQPISELHDSSTED